MPVMPAESKDKKIYPNFILLVFVCKKISISINYPKINVLFLYIRFFLLLADEFRSKVACENEVIQLVCNPFSRIAIYSASYGRTSYESIQCTQPQGVKEESEYLHGNCIHIYREKKNQHKILLKTCKDNSYSVGKESKK